MKSLVPPALAGALCLPATYSLSRLGSIPTSLMIVVVLGTLGGGSPWRFAA